MTETSRAKNPFTNWQTGYDKDGICQPHNDPYFMYRGENIAVNTTNRQQSIGIYRGLDSYNQLVLIPSIVSACLKEGDEGSLLRLEKRMPTLVSLAGVVSVGAVRSKDIEAILHNSRIQKKSSVEDKQSPTQ